MAAQKQAARKPRRRDRKSVPVGQAHIKSTFNNTIISITDPSGAVVSWASGGDVGFKGSRKSTPYAAGMAAESAARKAMEHGLKKVDVFVKGPGSGRETAIRSLQSAGLEVGSITDVTPQAHNGVRPPKRRLHAWQLAAPYSPELHSGSGCDFGAYLRRPARVHHSAGC